MAVRLQLRPEVGAERELSARAPGGDEADGRGLPRHRVATSPPSFRIVIDTNSHQVDANMQFTGTKAFAQIGYCGSYFRNNVESITFQNWALGPTSPTTNLVVSSTPNTNFNQVHFTGAYRKSSATTSDGERVVRPQHAERSRC